jgi:hypothetical protein
MTAANEEPDFSGRTDEPMLSTCRNCGAPSSGGVGRDRCRSCGSEAVAPVARWRRAVPYLAIGATIVSAMAAIGAREKIVRLAPVAARGYAAIGLPVNLRGLAFNDLHTSLLETEGRRVLTIEGALVNLRGQKTEVPDMRIAVLDADEREIYVWTTRPPKAALEPREETSFRLRLASPPPGAREVMVRFASAAERTAFGEKL